MRREDPNREYLLIVADAIGDLCNEIVSAPPRMSTPSLRLQP